MNGGRVTSRSACGLDCSFSTRETTSPEPASTRSTLMPVFLVNASNCVLYQVARPSALYTVTDPALPDPDDPVPPHALSVTASVAADSAANILRSVMVQSLGRWSRIRSANSET